MVLNTDSQTALVRSGFYLFLDLVVTAFGGWIFWLVVSKFTCPAEVGYATTALSLVALISGFFGMGLDYSLLREVARGSRSAFGTSLLFEVSILALISPATYFAGLLIYGKAFAPYITIGVAVMLLSGLRMVVRSSALALLESRRILLYDALGTSIRFGTGLALVTVGLGGLGIISANLANVTVAGIALLGVCYSKLGLRRGGLKELLSLLRIGLSNFPGQLAALVVSSLSIILLALLEDAAVVGTFFIALAVSSIAGGLAGSLATMALPVSSSRGADQSLSSLKLGISLTAPIVAGLATTPEFILSLIGPAYVAASENLRVLALAVIPWIICVNAVAKLNHLRMLKRLVVIGSLQFATFMASFLSLTPLHGSWGVALAILLSSTVASLPSIRWLGWESLKPIVRGLAAVTVGWFAGSQLATVLQPLAFMLAILSSLTTTFALKALTPRELVELVKILTAQTPNSSGRNTK